ncbi:MAG: hypothetical protein OXC92_03520 [Flavobacteriaceae bacterium]|nr:hypothetical protein [Flavobacteriaceae bacterium]
MKERKTKKERFETVAAKRVDKIITFIRLLRKCSNKTSYEFNSDQIEFMFNEMERELEETKSYFLKEPKKDKFSFDKMKK